MSGGAALARHEVVAGLRSRWNIIAPGLFSGSLALITMVYGFRNYLQGMAYESTFATGWVAYAMVMAGISASITATVDLSLDRVRYLLSLPLTPSMIVVSKMCGAAATAFVVSLATLALGNPLVLHLSSAEALVALVALIFQSLSVVGIMCTLSHLVPDITKLGLIGSIASGALQYLSSVYFPVTVFPAWMRPVIYANPLTHSVNLIRSLVVGAPAGLELVYLGVSAAVCVGLGVWSLTRSLIRRIS